MEVIAYGDPSADTVLVQPADEHDLAFVEKEVAAIRERVTEPFMLLAVKVKDWNRDLSPWKAPAVFGNENFGDGAQHTLAKILELCADPDKTYYLGGYSLAGLFALWAGCRTDRFKGIAAASPSAWFPGFLSDLNAHPIRSGIVYLSLGDREEKTRNPVMATVGTRLREMYDVLRAQGAVCTLEWNPGNHFKDADLRTANAFSWVMNTARAD